MNENNRSLGKCGVPGIATVRIRNIIANLADRYVTDNHVRGIDVDGTGEIVAVDVEAGCKHIFILCFVPLTEKQRSDLDNILKAHIPKDHSYEFVNMYESH